MSKPERRRGRSDDELRSQRAEMERRWNLAQNGFTRGDTHDARDRKPEGRASADLERGYETAAYDLVAWALALGGSAVADLLRAALDEEKAADKKVANRKDTAA